MNVLYMTRRLCGSSCDRIARGELTTIHLEKAKSRLSTFEAVLVLENFEDSLKILAGGSFQWRNLSVKKGSAAAGSSKKYIYEKVMNDGDWRSDMDLMTLFDVELFEFAKYLNLKQIREVDDVGVLENYKDLAKRCDNACCGKCGVGTFV